MSPSLRDGDYALARRVDPGALAEGDVVLVDHPEYGRIIKRLGTRSDDGFALSGDSPASTPPARLGRIRPDRILARLIWRIAPTGLARVRTLPARP